MEHPLSNPIYCPSAQTTIICIVLKRLRNIIQSEKERQEFI